MPYALVDDHMHSHPKFLLCSLDAIGLWALGLSWSSDHLTDGRIPRQQVERFAAGNRRKGATLAAELVAAGLWETADDGWQYHDFHDHNPSGAQAKEKRERISQKRSAAGRRGAASRWGDGKPDGKRHGKSEANGAANPVAPEKQADGPVPVPVENPPAPHDTPTVERPHEGAGGPAPGGGEEHHHDLVQTAMRAAAAHEIALSDEPVRNVDGFTTAKLKQYEPRRAKALEYSELGATPEGIADFFITGTIPKIRTTPEPRPTWTDTDRDNARPAATAALAQARANLASTREAEAS